MLVTEMDFKIFDIEKKTLKNTFLVEELSIQQLIDLAIDSPDNAFIEQEAKQELIKRGKDNIEVRIIIKKYCKKIISSLEALLNKLDSEVQKNKEVVKSFKNKFLSSVSILDRLQLEWQKYDLKLSK